MEYAQWAPRYARIREEFGFVLDREAAAANLLEQLLPVGYRDDPLARVRGRVDGREVIVVGLAPSAGPPPLWRRPASDRASCLIAADGATATCLAAGLVPSVVVTDLDGPIPSEIAANRRGSLVVVHAHGDNMPALREWVPQFPGEIAGSWSGAPRPSLLDVGGFTDGDRAAYLADHTGATRIVLWGFDFDHTSEMAPDERRRKLAKLAWARRLLVILSKEGRSPLLTWRPDGSVVPYDGGNADASTR